VDLAVNRLAFKTSFSMFLQQTSKSFYGNCWMVGNQEASGWFVHTVLSGWLQVTGQSSIDPDRSDSEHAAPDFV
jgi:hypothetical protein